MVFLGQLSLSSPRPRNDGGEAALQPAHGCVSAKQSLLVSHGDGWSLPAAWLLALGGPRAAPDGGLQQPETVSLVSWLEKVSLAAAGYWL